MRQGTTPTYTLAVDDYDLTDKTVFVTISRKDKSVTLTGNRLTVACDGTDSIITFRLTQRETFSLPLGKAEVQVRFVDAEGVALATEIVPIEIDRVLQAGVIKHE